MNERDKEFAKQADDEFTGIENDDLNHCLVGLGAIQRFADLIRADEREACAKLCESHVSYPSRLHFAAAIRARGNT